jgi:hydroxymethylglutaryl-CoA lyase
MRWPSAITLCEVGPRDGFQMEPEFIPTDAKIEIIDALSRTGLREIQATSFVHPKAVPQLRDAEEILARIARVPGVTYSALVPNERGAERAIAARVDRIDIVVSVSESHSWSNTRMSTTRAMERAREIVRLGEQSRTAVSIGFATALGCPFEGFPEYARLERLVGTAVEEYGIRRVSIADTVGMANPALVAATMGKLMGRFPETTFSLHLHNTRGMGLANLLAGLDAGVTHYDASIAGLGGCPFAPGATGNIATEDTVHMAEEMGIRTEVHLGALLDVARRVEAIVGHADSAILKAGPSSKLLGPLPEAQAEIQAS